MDLAKRTAQEIVSAERAHIDGLLLRGQDITEAENLLAKYKRSLATFERDLELLGSRE